MSCRLCEVTLFKVETTDQVVVGRQMAHAARNPKGARGLRVYAASVVVDDATASTSSSFLASTSQDPGSRPFPFCRADSLQLFSTSLNQPILLSLMRLTNQGETKCRFDPDPAEELFWQA